MEQLRIFIAIELPERTKQELMAIQTRLQARLAERESHLGRLLRWVEPQGIHLTLKFLGDTPKNRVAEIETTLRGALAGAGLFQVRLAGLGAFPNWRRPRVLWVGLEGELAALWECQQRVEAALAAADFPRGNRPFSPHLTLARVRDWATPEDRQRLGEALAADMVAATASIAAEAISIMRSELTPAGAKHTRLAEIPLGKG